jgi:hypothetical protein
MAESSSSALVHAASPATISTLRLSPELKQALLEATASGRPVSLRFRWTEGLQKVDPQQPLRGSGLGADRQRGALRPSSASPHRPSSASTLLAPHGSSLPTAPTPRRCRAAQAILTIGGQEHFFSCTPEHSAHCELIRTPGGGSPSFGDNVVLGSIQQKLTLQVRGRTQQGGCWCRMSSMPRRPGPR